MSLHINSQQCIDRRLISSPLPFEPIQHISIQTYINRKSYIIHLPEERSLSPQPQVKAMSQLVVLNLGKGNWQQGFSSIVAQLWQTDSPNPMQFIGGLPAAQELYALYQRWQQLYETMYLSLGWRRFSDPGLEVESDFEIDEEDVTHVSQAEFDNLCQQLQQCLNNWLNADLFRNIDRQLRTRLIPNDEIRFIITAEFDSVLRLPWCLWHFFED